MKENYLKNKYIGGTINTVFAFSFPETCLKNKSGFCCCCFYLETGLKRWLKSTMGFSSSFRQAAVQGNSYSLIIILTFYTSILFSYFCVRKQLMGHLLYLLPLKQNFLKINENTVSTSEIQYNVVPDNIYYITLKLLYFLSFLCLCKQGVKGGNEEGDGSVNLKYELP